MRYSGKIGYATLTETAPGVWEDVITERPYLGDVLQRTEAFTAVDTVIPQYKTTTSVSVLSANLDHSGIRYVSYAGVNWTVASVVREPPRMTIHIGEKYNGPTPNSP